jgi:hypothetical protein
MDEINKIKFAGSRARTHDLGYDLLPSANRLRNTMCYLAGRYPILAIPQERKMRQNKTKYTLRGRGFDLTIKCQPFSAAATIL